MACGSPWPIAYTAEICAGAGYDWLLFDGEHAPNTIQTLLAQLQAVSAYPVERWRARRSAIRLSSSNISISVSARF